MGARGREPQTVGLGAVFRALVRLHGSRRGAGTRFSRHEGVQRRQETQLPGVLAQSLRALPVSWVPEEEEEGGKMLTLRFLAGVNNGEKTGRSECRQRSKTPAWTLCRIARAPVTKGHTPVA